MWLACRSLFAAGVRCFDLDFVATQEHELIVSHPDRLQVSMYMASSPGQPCACRHAGCCRFGAAASTAGPGDFTGARQYLLDC